MYAFIKTPKLADRESMHAKLYSIDAKKVLVDSLDNSQAQESYCL